MTEPPYLTPEGSHLSLDTLFLQQKSNAVQACMMAETATTLLMCCLTEPPEVMNAPVEDAIEEARRFARAEEHHLMKYMRLPIGNGIPPEYVRFGDKIDRLALQTARLLTSTVQLYDLPKKLAIRRDFVEETERRRRERIEAKHLTAAMKAEKNHLPPPQPLPKREKEERPPFCSKCGKRPRVSGTLCEPCAKWMMSR